MVLGTPFSFCTCAQIYFPVKSPSVQDHAKSRMGRHAHSGADRSLAFFIICSATKKVSSFVLLMSAVFWYKFFRAVSRGTPKHTTRVLVHHQGVLPKKLACALPHLTEIGIYYDL